MAKTKKLTAKISANKLDLLIASLTAASKISDNVRLKKDENSLLIYALAGVDNSVHAFKYFTLKFDDYFHEHDVDELDFVITEIKKLTKQLQFYTSYEHEIVFEFNTMDAEDLGASKYFVKQCFITNTVFESFIVGGEPFLVRNLTLSSIKNRVDPNLKKFGFQLAVSDFVKIKKLISLDSTYDILDLIIKNENVKFKEKKWSLGVGKTNTFDQTISFKKSHMKNIEEVDVITVDIFDTFILFRGSTSDLMITLELAEY